MSRTVHSSFWALSWDDPVWGYDLQRESWVSFDLFELLAFVPDSGDGTRRRSFWYTHKTSARPSACLRAQANLREHPHVSTIPGWILDRVKRPGTRDKLSILGNQARRLTLVCLTGSSCTSTAFVSCSCLFWCWRNQGECRSSRSYGTGLTSSLPADLPVSLYSTRLLVGTAAFDTSTHALHELAAMEEASTFGRGWDGRPGEGRW